MAASIYDITVTSQKEVSKRANRGELTSFHSLNVNYVIMVSNGCRTDLLYLCVFVITCLCVSARTHNCNLMCERRHADDIIGESRPGLNVRVMTWQERLGRRGGDRTMRADQAKGVMQRKSNSTEEKELVFFFLVCTVYTQCVYVCVLSATCVCLK